MVVAADFMLGESFVTPARERVIKALSEARLIVLEFDTGMQRRTARVAHEALLTHWSRARSLFETHAVKLALKDDIERSAGRWVEQGDGRKAEAFLILGEAPLVEAEQLLADSRSPFRTRRMPTSRHRSMPTATSSTPSRHASPATSRRSAA